MWKFWVILSGLFLILESITAGFLVFWFSIGSVFAMIVSFFTDSIVVQVTTFIISSTILIFATRKFVNIIFKHDKPAVVNSFINKTGKVTVDINPLDCEGQVKVEGETWSAISEDNQPIKKDTEIIITKISGVKAVVRPK